MTAVKVGRSEGGTGGGLSVGGARPDPLALPPEDQRAGVSGHHRLTPERLTESARPLRAFFVAERLFRIFPWFLRNVRWRTMFNPRFNRGGHHEDCLLYTS